MTMYMTPGCLLSCQISCKMSKLSCDGHPVFCDTICLGSPCRGCPSRWCTLCCSTAVHQSHWYHHLVRPILWCPSKWWTLHTDSHIVGCNGNLYGNKPCFQNPFLSFFSLKIMVFSRFWWNKIVYFILPSLFYKVVSDDLCCLSPPHLQPPST